MKTPPEKRRISLLLFVLTFFLFIVRPFGPVRAVSSSADTEVFSPEESFLPDGGLSPGSVDARYSDAPKQILSEEIVSFEVECNFVSIADEHPYDYVYAYATETGHGVLAALEYSTDASYWSHGEPYRKIGLVSDDLFSRLQAVVKDAQFALNNGRSYYINGLPDNFGGSVWVSYASGESIRYDDNQSPVMSPETGAEIVRILTESFGREEADGPNTEDMVSVTYCDEWGEGCYSRYTLSRKQLISEHRFSKDGTVYHSEYAVPEDAMNGIRALADQYALLNWEGLYEYDWEMYRTRSETVAFGMRDGSEILIRESMRKPKSASRAIYEIYTFLEDLETASEGSGS